MAIYRRGNVWWYNINMKGKNFRGSCKTEDEQQALEFHDRLKADLWRERVLRDAKKRSVHEAIDRFLKEHEHKRSYSDDLRYGNWWKEQFNSVQVKLLDDVTPDLVMDIRDEELGRETSRGPISKATVNRKLAFLRSVLNAAAREWLWIEKAPKVRLLPGERERRRFLEPDEVVRLVEKLPRPYADMALLAVSTGLRQGNVFGLRWDQVNMQRKIATFPNEVMKNGLPFSCALNETAMSVIRKWIGQDTQFVFTKDGQPVTELPSRMWAKAVKEAGLEDVRWHDLRHTWASLLRQSGIDLADLQEMGGWESGVMVQRYAHLNVDHLAGKAAVMDGLLAPKRTVVQIKHTA